MRVLRILTDTVEKRGAKEDLCFTGAFLGDQVQLRWSLPARRVAFTLPRNRRIRRSSGMVRKCFEVLDGSGKVELVMRAREAPQPHALKAMMGL